MLTLKDFKKVLVTYHRDPDTYGAKLVTYQGIDTDGNPGTVPQAVLTYKKGKKKGVLVAIGPGIVGWSKCNDAWYSNDIFDKKLGIHIALSRAAALPKMTLVEKSEYYDSVPRSLQNDFAKMVERSFRYFQVPDKE